MKAIYKITNKINNKSYIGQSIDPQRRWKEHKNKNYHYKSMIGEAISKYGQENFSFEVLGWYEDYNEKEKYFIKFYNTLQPNGYNIMQGGENPPVKRHEENPAAKITLETAEKIQEDLYQFKLEKREIAKKYNVSIDIVRHINEGDCWLNDKYTYPIRGLDKEMRRDKIDGIIYLLQNSDMSQKEIGRKYNMCRTAITAINNGTNWHDEKLVYPLRKNKTTIKPILQISVENNKVIKEYESPNSAAKALGKNSQLIRKCARGECKTAYGYKWKYKN